MTDEERKIDDIRRCLDSGQKIQAIKMIRHATGLGLKESKDLADAKLANLNPEMITNLEPMPKTQGCGSAATILIGLGGLLYWLTALG